MQPPVFDGWQPDGAAYNGGQGSGYPPYGWPASGGYESYQPWSVGNAGHGQQRVSGMLHTQLSADCSLLTVRALPVLSVRLR